MITLGINAAFHDSSACLVRDGAVIAAAEEERFTRIKHGKRPLPFTVWELPYHAIDYCLEAAGAELADVDHVAYAYDPAPLLKNHAFPLTLPLEPASFTTKQHWTSPWEPLALAYVVNAERQLLDGAPHHIRKRFAGAKSSKHWQWHFVEHHLAHEASAFLAAPFGESAVMTLDGRGELATTSYGHFAGDRYQRIAQVQMPHSLGLLYEQVTDYLGFLHSSDEYKVMALASYGEPRYASQFRRLISISDGRYTVERPNLVELFGPSRQRGGELERKHFDIARSLQLVLEESAVALAEWLHRETGAENLAMAGGVALNCVMNARIRDAGHFKRVWVQPAAGDAGTALGAGLWTDWEARGRVRGWHMDHAYFGPEYSDDEIEAFLERGKLRYRRVRDVAGAAADILAHDKIVGWFQGRMEFGPRALGARSILASPLNADMQARLNEIKDREDFRPVAPVVLEEEAGRWFVGANVSPFMLFVHQVAPDKAARIPAVRHVDGTARIQTINRRQNERYYDLLKAFQARTGVPVLVNTSFNTRSEPVVCTPRDAVECFWTSPIDALVIGSFVIEK
ncbi:MAG: carbamoyltransferase [Betaproteobacteria bacterium]|nr:carbamoyltransferase [Betaproteobacteria bacterium]